MKFLVQKINENIVHDFAFELEQAKRYYDWQGKESIELCYDDHFPDEPHLIPIGTVEFVSAYLKMFYPNAKGALTPLNVPECLFEFAKRRIGNYRLWHDDMFRGKRTFCKSLTTIKHPLNGINDPALFDGDGGCQVSEVVEIESEWRVFVFHNEIQHIACYAGNCMAFPSRNDIEAMVDIYSDEAPVAYTLDVGVSYRGTFVIECHRFFSCGLYGFSDHAQIPKMFSQEWYEMRNMCDVDIFDLLAKKDV